MVVFLRPDFLYDQYAGCMVSVAYHAYCDCASQYLCPTLYLPLPSTQRDEEINLCGTGQVVQHNIHYRAHRRQLTFLN